MDLVVVEPRRGRAFPCWVHVPAGPRVPSPRGWPVVLYLHGGAERGRDPRTLLRHDLPRRLARDPAFPFVVVAPQCPGRTTWADHLDDLVAVAHAVARTQGGDARRVGVTGASMGGTGAWLVAAHAPEVFAAAVPVCAALPSGPAWPRRAGRAASVPVWAFHGALDRAVPPAGALRLERAHRAAGGDSRLSLLRGVGHAAWTPVYRDARLWDWVAAQVRRGGA